MTGSENLATAARVVALAMASYLCASAQAALAPRDGPTSSVAPAVALAAAQQKLSTMSVPFVPNAGQWDARAAFAAQTFAGTLFVTREGALVYSLPGKPVSAQAESAESSGSALLRRSPNSPRSREHTPVARTPGWALSETLVDANGHTRTMSQSTLKAPAGYRPMEGKVSYAIGSNVAQHADNLSTYERVNLGDMYPGVNVQLRATGNNVEKIFTVAPSHDPSQIHVKLAGAEKLEIGLRGELIAHTGNGPVAFTAPIAFQENDRGERVTVAVAYQLLGADVAVLSEAQPSDAEPSPTTAATYTFALGPYDPTRALVIDPLLQSTFHGGNGSDNAQALVIHPATGEVYIAGYAYSTDLPGMAGGAQSTSSGSPDSFVARFNAALTTRLQSTYLGGAGDDIAQTLAIHPATGEVYVAGFTDSANLPGVAGGAQSVQSGGQDAFIARFNAALTARLQSTYLGGTGDDIAVAFAIHGATGEVYVAGFSTSSNLSGNVNSGGQDAFVARFNPALTTLLRSTLLGGTADEIAYALAIHPATGEVYVAGGTTSTNLPGVAGGAQAVKSSGEDAFIARFNAALTTRLQSTYLGGTGADVANALVIHPATGDVYVAGYSDSTNLPGVVGGAQSAKSTGEDAFIARFNSALTTLLQSTYLGGTDDDRARALAIHPATGEVHVAGYSASTDLPGAAGGAQSSKSGGFFDGFVARFNPALTTRLQSTYLGGTGEDMPNALAIHAATGEVYVAGASGSSNLPGVAGGAQSVKSSFDDAFVSRVSADLTALNRIPNPFNFLHQSNVPPNTMRTSNEVQIVITPTPPDNQQTAYVSGAVGSEFCVTNTAGCCATPLPVCGGFASGWITAPYQFLSGDRIAVRHTSANPGGTAETRLIISGTAYPFRSSTGNANIACNLDINGDNVLSHTVEGLILVRAILGFGADAIVAGTGVPAWNPVRERLNAFCGTNFPYSPSVFQ